MRGRAQRHALARVRFKAREVWSLAEARQAFNFVRRPAKRIGRPSTISWLQACAASDMRRSARASSFAASLELAREGKIEMRQDRAFAPTWFWAMDINPGEERAA